MEAPINAFCYGVKPFVDGCGLGWGAVMHACIPRRESMLGVQPSRAHREPAKYDIPNLFGINRYVFKFSSSHRYYYYLPHDSVKC